MKKSSALVILIGIVLLVVGLVLEVPSDELSYYGTSDRSKIEEYVGGDAYNYIIGASLVGSQIAGRMIQKAIYTAVGALIICLGILIGGKTSHGRNTPVETLCASEETPKEKEATIPEIREEDIPEL
ncbi:MAG: hypothetical protein IJX82_05020 [Clostridia bacterium]|nr:hypothetical protein [Clostridia bacterium]